METPSEDIAYISWLDTFEVREWGRLPDGIASLRSDTQVKIEQRTTRHLHD